MQIFEASLDGPVLQSQITGVWSKWFRVTLIISTNSKDVYFSLKKKWYSKLSPWHFIAFIDPSWAEKCKKQTNFHLKKTSR
jgi:hypothetical protein